MIGPHLVRVYFRSFKMKFNEGPFSKNEHLKELNYLEDYNTNYWASLSKSIF